MVTLLHEWFAASAERWPDCVAIDVPPGPTRSTRQRWTYRELAAAAAQIRGQLKDHVRQEVLVAILLPRGTPWLHAAQLGVMQSGAGYVALDPNAPDDHLRHVLRDSGAVALVTDAGGSLRIAKMAAGVAVVQVPQAVSRDAKASVQPPAPKWLDASSLAYAIYTSGTTGPPKAVLLEHRGIVNLVLADRETFSVQPGERIAQGSSPAYDSSVEETWLALASGGTVVVMDDDAARLGPDLVAWLRQERIAVFCPPPTQLRAMACTDPARLLPDLRLLYVGGEALSQDLADIWAGACWLENGYGPTECSVTVVRGRMTVGRPVTIGKPVRGHHAYVLDERLQPVANGESGELCIAGPGLARGYLGQPDLTAQRFPEHARFGRIYRTGDLVTVDGRGDLVCLGRIDSQVKLRGYRIELEAVEATLMRCAGVSQAGCRLQGNGSAAQLIGYVVPRAGAPLDAGALRRELAATLPEYMVPARIAVLASLPVTVGGKLDRRALPAIPEAVRSEGDPSAPRDGMEAKLLVALVGILDAAATLSAGEDFFASGGDSLRAAQWISRLRASPDTAALTVRDVYELRTVRALAERLREVAPGSTPCAAPRAGGERPFLGVLLGQTIWLALGLWVVSATLYAAVFELAPVLLHWLGPVLFCLLLPLGSVLGVAAYTICAIAIAVVGKRLLVGEYVAERVPVGTSRYLRHWLVQQCARLVPWGLLQGTELQCMVLRWLGARIGARVHIHRGVDLQQGGWDLLTLGDDVTLSQDAALLLARLERGHLVLGAIEIGAGSTVGVRSCVSGGASLGVDAVLADSSWLAPGAHVEDRTEWRGIPAVRFGAAPTRALVTYGRELGTRAYALRLGFARAALSLTWTAPVMIAFAVALAIGRVDTVELIDWLSAPWSETLWLVAAAAVVAVPGSLVWAALLARWLTPPTGHVPVRSVAHIRIQLVTGILHAAGEWLSGTLFWPWWLRIAGMRIGPRCEISTILDTVPRHVQIGADTFFADGIYLAGPRVHRGVVSSRPTNVGSGVFLGNHAVVPNGQALPDDVLLGVGTVADDRTMTRGTDWFGAPPFALPRRQVVVADRRLTHEPNLLRRANRLFWESLRAGLPCVPLLIGLGWYDAIAERDTIPLVGRALVIAPLVTLAAGAATILFVLLVKWLLLGRVRPGHHVLWSCWCSRWDFFYVAWHRLARPLLTRLEGTLLLPWYLRAMGARIGRRTVLGSGFAQLVDPDMIHIEHGATVDAQFQAHSFEDRVLKIDRLHIRSGATIGHGAVLLYGADIGADAVLAPLSVVMKHEHLTASGDYEGFPVRAATGRAAAVRPASGDRTPR